MARQQIQVRRDTASAWAAANPILSAGEFGYETDTGKLKVGNGSTGWNGLSYFAGSGTLAGLTDVAANTRVDGSVLTYDEASAKFVASPVYTRLTLTDGGNF